MSRAKLKKELDKLQTKILTKTEEVLRLKTHLIKEGVNSKIVKNWYKDVTKSLHKLRTKADKLLEELNKDVDTKS